MPPATRGKSLDYKPIDPVPEDEQDEDERHPTKRLGTSTKDDSFVASRKPSKKSSTKTAGRPRGGKLRNLMLMPVDIFAEICQYLDPKDLRALSLTAQSLRSILMSQDAKHIWKSVLQGVPDLPECPPDLNEPQYIRLLFSSECYDCGIHCGLSDYYYRVLYCDKCFQINMDEQFYSESGRTGSLPREMEGFFTSGEVDNPCRNGSRARKYLTRHKKTAEAALSDYNLLLKSSPELCEKFLSDAKETHNMRTRTGSAIRTWKQAQEYARQMELDKLKYEHQKSIEDKLLLLGWQRGDIPQYGHPLREYHSLVRKPKKLTEKAWQTLLPKLEPILKSGKQSRLVRESMERKLPLYPSRFDAGFDTYDISQVFGASTAPDLTDADFDKYFLSNVEDDLTYGHAGGSGS